MAVDQIGNVVESYLNEVKLHFYTCGNASEHLSLARSYTGQLLLVPGLGFGRRARRGGAGRGAGEGGPCALRSRPGWCAGRLTGT